MAIITFKKVEEEMAQFQDVMCRFSGVAINNDFQLDISKVEMENVEELLFHSAKAVEHLVELMNITSNY